MDINQFWEILEKVKNHKNPENVIKEELKKLSPEELISYQEHFDTLVDNAYIWDLWGAAYLINEGCSDDSFLDFRYGLISKGRDIYEKAIKHPDILAEIEGEEIDNELFGYSAHEVYEEKTGEELPRKKIKSPKTPKGKKWNEKDLKSLLPHLWTKADVKKNTIFDLTDAEIEDEIAFITIPLVWLAFNNAFSPKLRKIIADTVNSMKKKETGPESILKVLDKRIMRSDITPKFRGFVDYFLLSPYFFNMFKGEFKLKFDTLNEVPLNWESYDRMSKLLDGRLKSWRMPGVHN